VCRPEIVQDYKSQALKDPVVRNNLRLIRMSNKVRDPTDDRSADFESSRDFSTISVAASIDGLTVL
jgi:hypothetical protein